MAPILPFLPIIDKVLNLVIPDPEKAAEAKLKAAKMAQDGELAHLDADVKLALGQIGVNLEEAKSESLFKSGWRPAVGWVGAISLGLVYIPKALVITALWTAQAYMALKAAPDITTFVLPVFPDLGVTDILGLLGSLLGFGILRQRDKETRK